MSMKDKLKGKLIDYISGISRKNRRKFNDYLKKYPYIMFYPSIDTNSEKELPYFMIGFSKYNPQISKGNVREAHSLIESDEHDNNIFYVYSDLALMIDESLYIETKEFDEIYISHAPLEIALNSPVLEKAKTHELMYSLTDYFRLDHLSYGVYELMEERISELPELSLDVIFKDIKKAGARVYGRMTQRVSFNSEVLGFLSLSGYDISSVETYIIDEQKWADMMNYIADKIDLRKYLDKPYKVLNPDDDCDIHFAVPGVNGFKYDTNQKTGDIP